MDPTVRRVARARRPDVPTGPDPAGVEPVPGPRTGTEPARAGVSPAILVLLTGAWLIVAPFALDYDSLDDASGAQWNDIATGAVVALVGLARAVEPRRTRALSLVPFVLGAWLLAAPFVLRYGDTGEAVPAIWNDLLSGFLLLMFAAVSWLVTRPSGRQGSVT